MTIWIDRTSTTPRREAKRRAEWRIPRALSLATMVALALVAAFVSLTTAARATTLIPLDLDTLARSSDAIVLARCDELWSNRVPLDAARPDGPRFLRTTARFSLLDGWKGAAPREIRVVQPGGVEGRRAALVPGAAVFEAGQESVLFLQDFHDGTWGVIGFFQGKLDLERDANGTLWLSRSQGVTEHHGEAARGVGTLAMLRLDAAGLDGRVPLAAFHDQVRAALSRAAAAGGDR